MSAPESFTAGGFTDPVFQSQWVFRAVMDALARPGMPRQLCSTRLAGQMPPAMAAIALTLCDHETPVWLDLTLAARRGVTEWLAFHTGAPRVQGKRAARFAFLLDATQALPLDAFAQGDPDYPDRSATLIVHCAALSGGPELALRGPGVDGTAAFAPLGLPAGFVEAWRANNARFPRGIDLLLVAGDEIAGLPRRVIVEAVEA